MSKIDNSIYNLNVLEELAQNQSLVHSVHPLIKLSITILYVVLIISFNRYEIINLVPFVIYPILIINISETPTLPILKIVIIALPIIIGIGIFNLFFNNRLIYFCGILVPSGFIVFISILFKSILTITATVLLIATTGINKLCLAMRMVRIPKIFVLQVQLTYRYISILIMETRTMVNAYFLRSPGEKGIHIKLWGPFLGQLLLRTYDRAQRIYDAMNLRGFSGEYKTGISQRFVCLDYIYLICFSLFFTMARIFNIPMLLGTQIIGVIP